MRCKCGYSYIEAKLKGSDKIESFAVVRDNVYKKFLNREIKVLESKGEDKRLKAIVRSAELVGSALICPECGLLCFSPAGTKESEFYRKVSKNSVTFPLDNEGKEMKE